MSNQSNSSGSEPLLKWFQTSNLTSFAAEISNKYADLATWLVDNIPRTPERTVALRKLLESKDGAIRAGIDDRA